MRHITLAIGHRATVTPYTWDCSAKPRRLWQRVTTWLEDLGHIVASVDAQRLANLCDEKAPSLIISHSLGTVIAYKACKYFARRTHRMVTLGSPLVYAERGLVPLSLPPIARPSTVARWANVWGVLDLISHPPVKSGRLKAAHRNWHVWTCHDAVGYLKRQQTQEAIRWAAA